MYFSGHETKAMLNNRSPRYKRSKLERRINRDVIYCVVLLLLMCFLSAISKLLFIFAMSKNILAAQMKTVEFLQRQLNFKYLMRMGVVLSLRSNSIFSWMESITILVFVLIYLKVYQYMKSLVMEKKALHIFFKL